MRAILVNVTRRPGELWRQHVLPRYQQLQQRERRLVMGAAVVLPLLIVVFGLWLPLRDKAAAINAAMPELQAQLAEAKSLAARVAKGGVAKAAQGDLLSVVDAAARASNIRQFITRIKPQPMGNGQSALLQLRKAPYADAVRFFGQVASQGIATERARITDVSGNGLVDVDITFSSQ